MFSTEISHVLELLRSYDIGQKKLTVKSIIGQMVAKHIEGLIDSDPIAVKKMIGRGADALMMEAEELILMESFQADFGVSAFGYVKTEPDIKAPFLRRAA